MKSSTAVRRHVEGCHYRREIDNGAFSLLSVSLLSMFIRTPALLLTYRLVRGGGISHFNHNEGRRYKTTTTKFLRQGK